LSFSTERRWSREEITASRLGSGSRGRNGRAVAGDTTLPQDKQHVVFVELELRIDSSGPTERSIARTPARPQGTGVVRTPTWERREISVRGIVQGVGFRPFVYALARRARTRRAGAQRRRGGHIEAEGPLGGAGALRAGGEGGGSRRWPWSRRWLGGPSRCGGRGSSASKRAGRASGGGL
jgi:hypothetical protein